MDAPGGRGDGQADHHFKDLDRAHLYDFSELLGGDFGIGSQFHLESPS